MQPRKLLALSAALASALALSACGSSQNDNTAQTPASSASTTAPASAAPSGGMDQPLSAADAKVDVTLQDAPALSADGQTVAITVNLANHGTRTLSSIGAHPVNVGAHLMDASGQNINNDFARSRLANPLPPNGQETVTINMPAAKLVGNSVAILPVQEQVAWFDHWGVQPVMVGPFTACTSDATKVCDKSGHPLGAPAAAPASSAAQ